jgi:primosomal protein N' (replication factor Y)
VRELLPEARILLIEDLNKITPKILAEHDIFIGTQKISSLPIENLGLTAFLLVESDLAVPDYDIEESMYHQIRHFFSRSRDIILQTRSPKLPLIADVTGGNFRSFFQRTMSERKQFHLPPFTQMVTIHISDTTENLVKQRIASTASSMIEAAKVAEDTTVIYDHLLVEKRAGKYRQKILIRSPKMLSFLEPFRAQIIRGRGIEVEWL